MKKIKWIFVLFVLSLNLSVYSQTTIEPAELEEITEQLEKMMEDGGMPMDLNSIINDFMSDPEMMNQMMKGFQGLGNFDQFMMMDTSIQFSFDNMDDLMKEFDGISKDLFQDSTFQQFHHFFDDSTMLELFEQEGIKMDSTNQKKPKVYSF